jgi:SAM-dependent methyltransferase
VADERLWNIYRGMEFLTPGAVETLDIAIALVPEGGARVLEVAYGKGEAAFRLAEHLGCSVFGVDMHTFAAQVMRRAAVRGVAGRVAFAIGDGGCLPVRDGVFDLAICMGAPSIVGTERCLAAMERALRPGGALVVSDWVWAKKPIPPEAIPPGLDIDPLTLDEYAALVRHAGFEIETAEPLPQRVWYDYYAPLRAAVKAMRAERPADVPQPIVDEIRVYDSGAGAEYWRYAVVVGRKR